MHSLKLFHPWPCLSLAHSRDLQGPRRSQQVLVAAMDIDLLNPDAREAKLWHVVAADKQR